MSEHNIKVDVPGAQATYGPATAEVAGNRGVVGPDGVRPGLGATLAGMSSTYNANVDGTTQLTGQGSQFANGFDAADQDGAAKAGAAAPKSPVDPSSPANTPTVPGGDSFASRLTPNDLAKLASQPYQSAMLPSAVQAVSYLGGSGPAEELITNPHPVIIDNSGASGGENMPRLPPEIVKPNPGRGL